MPDPIDPSGDIAAQIARLAKEAFDRFWKLVQDGTAPRDAIEQAQAAFTGEFTGALKQAFSGLLLQATGVADVRNLPVSGGPLSARLYDHNVQVARRVAALTRSHAQGVLQARELAMAIYDGYVKPAPDVRPLEGTARGALPQPLRELIDSDPEAKAELSRLIEKARAQVDRLKSAPLRAAYTELLDKWETGKAQAAIRKATRVAVLEKNRYFANRIAQTELARAYMAQKSAEFMADDKVEVLEVRIAPGHPRTDICDLYAHADLFGLGPGCYPKEKTPRPPYHPFCRCRLRDRPDLAAKLAREHSPDKYLKGLPEDEAARVIGSRAALQRVLQGTAVDTILNESRDPAYHVTRVGDATPRSAP